MKSILILVRKDLALFRRDRAAVMLTFFVPFCLIFLFGKIFDVGGGGGTGPTGVTLAVVNESADSAAAAFVDALKRDKTFNVRTQSNGPDGTSHPLKETELRPLMQRDEFRFALVLPADLLTGPDGGIHAKFLSNPRNEIETQVVTGALEKTAFTSAPQLFGRILQAQARKEIGPARTEQFNRNLADNIAQNYGGDRGEILSHLQSGEMVFNESSHSSTSAESAPGDLNSLLKQFIHIDREQVVGNDIKSPQATQMVGGWAMQFLLFAVTTSAAALFNEKDKGIFQRILSGPTKRSDILWSKFIYGMLLGLIQLVVLFVAGHFLFDIEIVPYLFPLALVCLFAAAACASFGMLISAVAKTQESARGFSTLLILMMSALGGAWFPVSLMPVPIQNIAHLTLVYWAMEGFSQVLWAHVPLFQLLPTLGVLAAITAGVLGVSWWRFNRGAIFD